jgi:heat shock protein HtpX
MLAAGLTPWMPWALIAYSVGLPVAVIGARLAMHGGPGVAESMGGVPADQYLLRLADEAAIAVGVPPPQHVYEIPRGEPNAFAASGFLADKGSTVAVTSGLRRLLSTQELKAVLAHEMGHLRHKDVAKNMHVAVAVAGLGGLYEAGRILLNSRSDRDSDDDSEGGTAGLGMALMGLGLGSQAVAHVVQLAASRDAELKADAAAAESFGADSLISALTKIDQAAALGPADLRESAEGRKLAFAMISDGPSEESKGRLSKQTATPQWRKKLGNVLRTHPPLEERIAALEAFEPQASNGCF